MLLWLGVVAVYGWLAFKGIPRGLHAHIEGGPTPKGFDFIHYFLAAEAVTTGDDIYASFQGGYVYPPMLAVLLVPLLPLGIDHAAIVWHLVNATVLGAALVITWLDLRRRAGLAPDLGKTGAAVLITLLIGFDLVKRQFAYCQVDGLVTFGIVLGLVGLHRLPDRRQLGDGARRAGWIWPLVAGLGLAFAINIKFLALGFIPYLLLTRRWTAAGSATLGTVAIALSTALVFGWERNLEYLRMSVRGLLHVLGVSTASTGGFDPHPITWANSVSVTSALARVAEERHIGTAVVIGVVGAIVGAWGLAAMLMYRARGLSLLASVLPVQTPEPAAATARPFLVALEWMSVTAAILVFSPQTTKRHALILMPAIMLASTLAVRASDRGARRAAIAALAVIAGAIYLPPGGLFPEWVLDAWRWNSVFGWCVLAFALLLLWAGMRYGVPGQANSHGADPNSDKPLSSDA